MIGLAQVYPKVMGVAGGLYERVFHEPMGNEVERFFHNLSYVTIGTLVATVFSFTFNILSGRLLGPAGYGQFTLIQSLGMLFYLPMLAGLNSALIKRVAEDDDSDRHQSLISTAYLLVLGLTTVSVIVYLAAADAIAGFFSISSGMLTLAVVFAVLFVFYTLTTSTLLGLHEMKVYAIFQPVFSVIMFGMFVFFYLQGPLAFEHVVFSMLAAYGITAAAILVRIRRHLSFSFRLQTLKLLRVYALLALVACIAFTLYQNTGKLLLNHYLSIEDVGIYGVYYYSAFTIITLFSSIFTTVLYPSASRHGDIGAVFSRVARGFRYYLALGVPGVLVTMYVMLRLFGSAYPVIPSLMLLFALTAVIVNGYGLFQWIFNAGEVRVGMVALRTEVVVTVLALAFIALLVPPYGIHGAIGGLGMAFAVGVIMIYHGGRRLFSEQRKKEALP